MSNADMKLEIQAGLNADGVKAGLNTIGAQLQTMRERIKSESAQGAKALESIGEGAKFSEKQILRATQSTEAALKKQIIAFEAGGTATRKYQEAMAALRGADVAALAPLFDRLESAKVKADSAAKGFGGLGSASVFLQGQLAALAGSLTLGSMAAFVLQINNGIDALNDIKDATGSTIENISALEDVGKRTGANLDLVGSVLIKFNDVLSKATPKSDIALQLQAIGLSAMELKQLDPAEALLKTAQALDQYADDGNKARLVQDLFGKSVKEAAPFLKDLAEQSSLVAKVTTQQAEEAEKFNKQLFQMQANVDDLSRRFSGPWVKAINEVADAFRTGEAAGKGFLSIAWERYWSNVKGFYASSGITSGPPVGSVGSGDTALARATAADDAKKPGIVLGPTAAEIAAAEAAARKAEELRKRELAEQQKFFADMAGLQADYYDKLARAQNELAAGNITEQQYVTYVEQLIQKQPFATAATKAHADALQQQAQAGAAANAAWDDYFAQLEKARLANEGQIKFSREYLEQLQFENSLLGLNAQERAVANAMRELERQGVVKGTDAWKKYADSIKSAVIDRETQREAMAFWSSVESTAKNVWTDVASGGQDAFKRIGQTLKAAVLDVLWQMTGRQWFISVGTSLGVPGAALAGTANAGTSAFGNAASSFGTSTLFGGTSLASIGTSMAEGFMATITSSGGVPLASAGTTAFQIGAAAPYAAAAVAALAAVGAFRSTKTVGSGLMGTLGEGGQIDAYDLRRKSGYLFGGPDYSISNKGVAEQNKALQDAFLAMRTATSGMAEALGKGGDAIKTFTTTIGKELIHPDTGGLGLKFDGLTPEQAAAKVQAALAGANDEMAQLVLGTTEYTRAGETASQTLARLSGSLTSVNAAWAVLGFSLESVSLAGANTASAFVDLMGGLENLNAVATSYYANFYTQTERTQYATEQLTAQLAGLGQAMPATRDGFRALVEAAEQAGDDTLLAGLLNLQDEFAALVPSTDETSASVKNALANIQDFNFTVSTTLEDQAQAALKWEGSMKRAARAAERAAVNQKADETAAMLADAVGLPLRRALGETISKLVFGTTVAGTDARADQAYLRANTSLRGMERAANRAAAVLDVFKGRLEAGAAYMATFASDNAPFRLGALLSTNALSIPNVGDFLAKYLAKEVGDSFRQLVGTGDLLKNWREFSRDGNDRWISNFEYYSRTMAENLAAVNKQLADAGDSSALAAQAIGRLNSAAYVFSQDVQSFDYYQRKYNAIELGNDQSNNPEKYANYATGKAIASGAKFVASFITTQAQEEVKKALIDSTLFADFDWRSISGAFDQLSGTYDTEGLEYAFNSLSVALVNGAISAEQYNALLEYSRTVYLGLSDAVATSTETIEAAYARLKATALSNEQIAQQRLDLESRLFAATASQAQIAEQARTAIDASNRALYDQVLAAEAAKTAAEQLAVAQEAIASERAGLEQQLLQAQGNTAALRELERNALDESNRALYDQIKALEDQATAAELAKQAQDEAAAAAQRAADEVAAAMARVADERAGLERQLLQVQGDTAALRALERSALDESNRALYDQIKALEDQAAAAAAAKQAQDEWAASLRSAYDREADVFSQAVDSFRSLGKSLREFLASLSAGTNLSPEARYAAAGGEFGRVGALARAGDKTALESFQSVAQEFLDASRAYNASGASYFADLEAVKVATEAAAIGADAAADVQQLQLDALKAQVSALVSIDDGIKTVAQLIAQGSGQAVPAFASGGLAGSGWALVGEQGPELVNFANPGRVYTAEQTRAAMGNDNTEVVAELRQTRAVLAAIMARIEAGDQANTEATSRVEKRLAAIETNARLRGAAPQPL